ncbi:MAG: tetratricopeptide repeat protein [Bacteroidota bacterium]
MKTRFTLLLLALFVGFGMSYGQQDEECMNNLSIFDSYAKNKKYDDAYEPWMLVRNKCPKFNRAIYVRGQKILEHKIKNSSGAEKVAFVNDLIKLKGQYNENYASKYATGKMLSEQAQLSYKYRKELGKSDEDLYNMFDNAFKTDLKNFKSAQGLYTYFSLIVDLYDAGKKTAQEMFDKYDDVNEKIESEIKNASENLNKYSAKEEAGETLSKKDNQYKKFYSQTLEAFDKVQGSMDTKLGERANCEVLIPLYKKDFEQFKNDATWLQRAMNRMYAKECTDDPLFIQIVQQKNTIEPNASTAYYLGILKDKEGNSREAEEFFKQSIELESDPLQKAKLNKRLGEKYYKKGSYGKARQYYREALRLNPADGSSHLRIAAMYAKSANRCGDTNFNKRAVFWLAASEARKAGRVDPRLKKAASQTAANYLAKAPTKSEIFSAGNKGETIRIGCWIGGSVVVPSN